jgi:hypothetical protein
MGGWAHDADAGHLSSLRPQVLHGLGEGTAAHHLAGAQLSELWLCRMDIRAASSRSHGGRAQIISWKRTASFALEA